MSNEDAAFEAYLEKPSSVLKADALASKEPSVHKYMAGIVDGKTKYQAAIDAGYSESAARKSKEAIESTQAFKALEKEFLPNMYIFNKIKEGLNATKIIKQNGIEKEVPDYAIREKYIQLQLKIAGLLKGGTEEPEDDDNLKYTKSVNVDWEKKLIKGKVKEIKEGEIIDGIDSSTL